MRSFAFLVVAVLLLGRAEACPGDKVKVTLLVILAKEEGNVVDPLLKDFAKDVQKEYPSFKSFRVKTMLKESMSPDEKRAFKLVEDKTADVVVRHGADKHNRVSLAVTAPDQGEIVYRTVCGKYLPIVTRYQTKSKERLMIAIQVQPCNE